MLSYTKATLKAHLKNWVEGNGNDADADFVNTLDEIIQLGEIKLSRALDLDSLDSVSTTSTSPFDATVFKPENLIVERLLVISVAGSKHEVVKRSRAFIESVNSDDATGEIKYYSDYDEDRWFVAHLPDDEFMFFVHGSYTPASIVDGDDNNTTWFSTRMPDMLAFACESAAAENLKNYTKKAEADANFEAKLQSARSLTANLQRSDIEDIVGNGTRVNRATISPEPTASA